MATASIADPLRRIVGEHVRTGDRARRFSVAGVLPAAVVAPADAEQVAALMGLCRQHGWTVEPAGLGSWLGAGRRPERVDIVVSTERLAAVDEYEPADLTIGVGAGMTIDRLQREVGRYRQMLALDPPGSPVGTLGATFATASAGPLRLSYGTPRDHALGVQVVTGDGRILQFGGRVVKNVAGYDFVRLLVGSRGRLGIITRLHVRLHPVQVLDVTVVFQADDVAGLIERAAELPQRVELTALEILSPSAAQRLLGQPGWTLVARVQGNEDGARDARERLREMLGSVARTLVNSEAPSFWAAQRQVEGDSALMIRLSDLPSRLLGTIEAATSIARAAASTHGTEAEGLDWHLGAHAGNGIVRLWTGAPPPAAALVSIARAIGSARDALAGAGGTVIVSEGAPLLPDDLDPHGDPGPVELMRAIAREFDPHGILAPGRFAV